ncbi:MAG: EF-hand domain-containing protein [archaeon]|nr:EF-hand domain-containing protein [archaeon]
MISNETEQRVARLLLVLAEGERNSEISRQVLSDNYDFDPFQVFSYLDIAGKNMIGPEDIVNYLRNKGTFVNPSEAELIILFYDQDTDGLLSYKEFLNMVQSAKSLKKKGTNSNEELSFNVDYSLTKLMEKEVSLARNLLSLIEDLQMRSDFNIHGIYHLLGGCNPISGDGIKEFLETNEATFLNSDIVNIIKRLDFNKDGRVDLCEFHSFLGFPNNMTCTKFCGCNCCNVCTPHHHHCHCGCSPCISRSNSPSRNESPIGKNNSPLRSNGSPLQTGKFANPSNSMGSTFYNSNISPNEGENEIKKISPNLSLRRSPERKYSPRNRRSPLNQREEISYDERYNDNRNNLRTMKPNDNIPGGEKEKFLEYLNKVMTAEGEIEKNKTNLSLKQDLNVEDAFRIFELDGRGYLTEDDIDEGFNRLEVPHSIEDVRLFIKRYDNLKQGVITFPDFFDIITPFEKDFRNMVEQRPPNSCCSCRCPEVFSTPTKVFLKNLFNIMINYEKRFNEERKEMRLTRARMPTIFREIDRDNKGYFTEEDLGNFLRNNYALTSEKEKDLLFIRLDRNRNGKVERYEVEDEITPLF